MKLMKLKIIALTCYLENYLILILDAEADQFVKFAQSSTILNQRKNVGYHIVFREGVS